MKLESFENKYKEVIDEGCVLSGYLNSYKLTIFGTYNEDGTSMINYIMQCELESGGSSVKNFENWEELVLYVKNLESL